MNKPSSVTDSLKAFQRLGRGEMTPNAVRQIRQAIRSRTSLLVSAAVDIAADKGLSELLTEIESAFDKFLVDGENTDKGCRAKTSIVVALNHFEFTGTAVLLAESAALAIGGSHVPEALGLLKTVWDDNIGPTVRQKLLLPVALVRSDEAFDFLLEVLERSDRKMGLEALLALRLYQGDRDKTRVGEVVRKKGDKEMTKRFKEEFGL